METVSKILSAGNRINNGFDELRAVLRNPALRDELIFLAKLHDLANKYQFTPSEVIHLLDPGQDVSSLEPKSENKLKATRSARSVKRYRHPSSGELIETRGANHKRLKEWKAQYGSDTVEGWREG
ncbi:hypothetical protein BV326_04943 [Pseudomonas syringae pv. actinidiae]|uniref:histone-like nucleoid-structuring protein, MvaT/MvaU family n=1 Tax=Pseudomonas syringae TaxID=317 RepID=UPI000A226651|nr:histone-like nucleoid-structuring protein, MvaT/MvaU family [Pseudomonas syringae]OSR66125.1 hypothetical protein BV326_04943 [Pseudomonas syringae pv. actinidiae]